MIFQKSASLCEPTVFPCEPRECECVGYAQIAQPHGLTRSRHFHFFDI